MGFAGFMSESDEQERTHRAAIVAICEKCGLPLTMDNWWKIGGKNLCDTHGKAYAEYLKT